MWGYNSVGRVAALQAACRRFESDYLHHTEVSSTIFSIFENRKLEIKENYNSYIESERFFLLSVYGHTTDALASGGDEGRERLRQASGSRQQALIRRFPNGATRQLS